MANAPPRARDRASELRMAGAWRNVAAAASSASSWYCSTEDSTLRIVRVRRSGPASLRCPGRWR